MALKVKDLQSLKRKDPKLYEILVAAENAAKPVEVQSPAKQPGTDDTPAQPKKDLNYRPPLPKRNKRTKRRRHAASQANNEDNLVWVEGPDVVGIVITIFRWALIIAALTWAAVTHTPSSVDGYIGFTFFAVWVFGFAYAFGLLLSAMIVGTLEKFLPRGRGRWVKKQRK